MRVLASGLCSLVCSTLLAACGDSEAAPGADTPAPDAADTAAPDGGDTTADTADATPDTTADTADVTPPDPNQGGYTFGACGDTPEALRGCVDPARLEAAVRTLAVPRPSGSAGWKAAQDHCVSTLEDLGFEVSLERTVAGANVVGKRLGTDRADEWIVLGANYDSREDCAGADDNATGLAAALEVARVLAPLEARRSLMVTCWDDANRRDLGAETQAEALRAAGSEVVLALSLDALGTTSPEPESHPLGIIMSSDFPAAASEVESLGNRGIYVALIGGVNASPGFVALEAAADALGLPAVRCPIATADINSSFLDYLRFGAHAPFWERGFPTIQVTEIPFYRSANAGCLAAPDTPDVLDYAFLRANTAMTAAAVASLLVVDEVDSQRAEVYRPCDVVAQDCPDGKRCILTDDDGYEHRACVAPAETPVGEGEVCTRPTGVLGVDTCAPGQLCALYGGRVLSGSGNSRVFERVCSRMCNHSLDCAPGEVCLQAGGGDGSNETGICRPVCDGLGAGCAGGDSCMALTLVEGLLAPVCAPPGSSALGAECGSSLDCAGGSCYARFGEVAKCAPLCGEAAPCASGQCLSDGELVEPTGTTEPAPWLGVCR